VVAIIKTANHARADRVRVRGPRNETVGDEMGRRVPTAMGKQMPWTHEWAMWLLYAAVLIFLLKAPPIRRK
jgi:hypothetical protein